MIFLTKQTILTSISVLRNHIKRADSIMNTKTIYCSDMYSIRKLKQPLKQKVPF